MNLTGKTALVTGGTLGIGAAIALDLAGRGADVVVAARHVSDGEDSIQRRITALGRQCLALVADFAKADDCRRCVAETVNRFGRLDVLVHNAGGPSWGNIEAVDEDQWQYTMDVHLNANYHLCRAALPHMRKAGEGAIITISSAAGIRGVPNAIAYATAKGALPQFTRSLARDLADDNIRVNCVAPGVIRTRFHDEMTEERKRYNLEHRIPLHREGTAEQVAEVVGMLVANDYITGETITIDGGLTSRIV